MEVDPKEITAFLDKGIKIPAQPKVLLEVDELVGEPRANIKAIAALVAHDAGVTAALFRIANSSAFALSKQMDSVEGAISILGLEQVLTLVKCTLLRQAIGGDAPVYEKFWERSGYIAQLAATIARKQKFVCHITPEHAYMAGLFFECGVPLLMQRFPEYCAAFRLSNGSGWPTLTEEDRLLDTDHAVAGYLVSHYWRLPEFIGLSIRYHHDIFRADAVSRTMVAILLMATHLYNLRHQQPDDAEWLGLMPTVLLELGLDADGRQEFEEDIFDAFVVAS